DFHNTHVYGADQEYVVWVEKSSDITFDGGSIENRSASAVGILGTSSDITVQRTTLESTSAAVVVAPGATGTVISTNVIDKDYTRQSGVGVSVQGGADTTVVGNTMTA